MTSTSGRNQQNGQASDATVQPRYWSHYYREKYDPAVPNGELFSRFFNFFSTDGWGLLHTARGWFKCTTIKLKWPALVNLLGPHDHRLGIEFAETTKQWLMSQGCPPEALEEELKKSSYFPLARVIDLELARDAENLLTCMAAAAHETLFVAAGEQTAALRKDLDSNSKIQFRISHHPGSFLPISAVKADQIRKFVTIRGTVIRITPIKPLVIRMQFVCAKCGEIQDVDFPDGRFTQPTSCGAGGCKSRILMPNRASAVCIDWQRIQLQGLPRDERNAQGRVPRPMDVELLQDVAGCCSAGDVVTVTGYVKVISGEAVGGTKPFRGGGDAKKQCLYLPYVEAVSVVAQGRDNSTDAGSADASNNIVIEPDGPSFLPPNMPGFTSRDLEFINKFTEECDGDQFRQLVLSLCPSICGMTAVKCGLLLALFGGVPKGAPGNVPVRGDIHLLLVGDPGIGKSQLLQAAAAAAPRGLYVCGSSSSSAGLTVSIARENGEYFFDAGALVLADRGVCCIDEFDKATSEHASMLGAMEQQEVAVAKAGLVASLPARTTVLAAANPCDGQYNRSKTLMQNLKMSPAMLSRFDLIFLLLDKPDQEHDERLTRHVLAAHNHGLALLGPGGGSLQQPMMLTDGRGPLFMATSSKYSINNNTSTNTRPPLIQRLKQRKADDEPLPTQLLRKYIAYARQYCHPRLSNEALHALKSFFLELRGQSAGDSSAPPITHRQLESLIRLAEARTRIDLRDTITLEDAQDVVEIMKETLDGMLSQGPSMIDFGVGAHAARTRGKGVQAERRRFVDALQRHCSLKGEKNIEVSELYDIADRIELAVPDTRGFIDFLNESGDLLKRGGSRYEYTGHIRVAAGNGYNSQHPGIHDQEQGMGVGQKRDRQFTTSDDGYFDDE